MNDITNLVTLVSVASGYICFSISHITRYRMTKFKWERRIFESALLGGALFAVSRLLLVSLFKFFPALHQVNFVVFYKEALPFSFSGTLLITLILAVSIGLFQNILLPRGKALVIAYERFGNALQQEIIKSFQELCPLLVKLQSGKIIVGFVITVPDFDEEIAFIVIQPLLEGWESKKGNEEFIRSYHEVYKRFINREELKKQEIEIEDFNITLDMTEIVTGRRFDPSKYLEIETILEESSSET